MKRKVILTSDGSSTIHLPEWDEHYHSIHGAIQEARHVFIESGFAVTSKPKIRILEIGFGTGLNCFITYLESVKMAIEIDYVGLEAYPVSLEEMAKLNYVSAMNATKFKAVFQKMHSCKWEQKVAVSPMFSLTKRKQLFQDINDIDSFDLIYFDAFGARVQPELWTEEIFNKMFIALKNGGVLVTYSAKGSVRRAMQATGFKIERLPGPPGKREMLRGSKK